MKKFDMNEIMQKSIQELIKMRNDLRKELFELKMKNSLRNLKQTHLIKIARRNIARLNTALNSKIKEKYGDNR